MVDKVPVGSVHFRAVETRVPAPAGRKGEFANNGPKLFLRGGAAGPARGRGDRLSVPLVSVPQLDDDFTPMLVYALDQPRESFHPGRI